MIGVVVAVVFSVVLNVSQSKAEEVSFSRDILPVLSDRCFHCHGPDESHREADLRLDLEESAKEDWGGYAPVTPNRLDESEVWQRITSDDPDTMMPPPDSHRKPLSESEREAIRTWILTGAKWGKHWSFEKPVRPSLANEHQHPIDAFVMAKLEDHGLAMSEPADPHTLLRRISFDLTGLAPTAAELTAFEDGRETQYQNAIDRLLQSPHYAERMAMWWLDAARYSDSDGFQQDATRQNWPWRDWVIRQFQQNVSFRDFTLEQFAGDLLVDATPEQQLATCFHRNHMTNGEGGRDPEESRIDYVIDRVNTTGTVWLGLTLGCVQCHSHKFDPISQRDYYAMSAFFNSIDEDGRAGMKAKPYLDFESQAVAGRIEEMSEFVEQRKRTEAKEREAAMQRFERWLEQQIADPPDGYQAWQTPKHELTSSEGTLFRIEEDQTVQTFGPLPRHDDYRVSLAIPDGLTQVTGFRIEVLPDESHVNKRFTRGGNGEFTLTSVLAAVRTPESPSERPLEISRAVADFESEQDRPTDWDKRYANISKTLNDDARDGWTTEGAESIKPHVGVFELDEPTAVKRGDRLVVVMRHRSTHGHANIGRFRVSLTAERGETVKHVDSSSPMEELIEVVRDGKKVEPELRKRLLDQYLLGDDPYQIAKGQLSIAQRQLSGIKSQAGPRKVMVLAERKDPRETHVLVRGVWDAKGDVVQRGVLPSVLDWPAEKTQTRLDLAKWLVDSENPLTARVIVNHLWQIMFGRGLVRTPDDFGLQGELPTHPKLLDWLAVEFIENDWDVKHILRLIATSQTYRQGSDVSAELLQADPENRLLARAPRFRLPAWMIRDNALHVSGLLNPAIGGPPVFPEQPEGVWGEITMGRFDYQPSLGPEQYRRTVYAFWRRSSAPTFLFDSAQRRVCEVGTRRTNTPLHALTLLNDVTMLEAARALADSMIDIADDQEPDGDADVPRVPNARFHELAKCVLSRELHDDELNDAFAVWSRAESYYRGDRDAAIEFCNVGQRPNVTPQRAADTAAWMTVASLFLNLDEAMTRE